MSTVFEQALAERGPEIRKRYANLIGTDYGEHVFACTWPRNDGTTDLIVWRNFEGMVGCVARHEHFGGPPIAVHYVLVHEGGQA